MGLETVSSARVCSALRRRLRTLRSKEFTEPVALLSTQPTDRPLPRRAFRLSFDLLALRARCVEEPMGGRSTRSSPRLIKMTQFAPFFALGFGMRSGKRPRAGRAAAARVWPCSGERFAWALQNRSGHLAPPWLFLPGSRRAAGGPSAPMTIQSRETTDARPSSRATGIAALLRAGSSTRGSQARGSPRRRRRRQRGR